MADEPNSTPETETPAGFSLEHDAVQPGVWETIRHWLSSGMLPESEYSAEEGETAAATMPNRSIYVPIPWETGPQMQGRKIAQFGNCRYNYDADIAEHRGDQLNVGDDLVPPIPDYIFHTLLDGEQGRRQYTQCIINVYEANNEIPWHLDHEHFGPKVLVYTFGENRPLLLRKPCNDDEKINHGESILSQRKGSNQIVGDKKVYIYSQSFPRHCSKYILSGPARHSWEHSVPSGKGRRVSITFRSWVGPK